LLWKDPKVLMEWTSLVSKYSLPHMINYDAVILVIMFMGTTLSWL